MKTSEIDSEAVRTMLHDGELGKLKELRLTRYQLRTTILPIVREHLNIEAEVKLPGLRTNWCGRHLMSRFAI
jgi:hypothetical protein